MAIFKKLNIGDVVATSGTKAFRKLTTEEPIGNYIKFSSPSAFTLSTANAKKNWDGVLEYSTDENIWNAWDGTSTLSADSGVMYIRGTGNTIITGDMSVYREKSWVLVGSNIACDGNIENLLDYATVANGKHPRMASGCYHSIFCACTSLTTAPVLPATSLASKCYFQMFYGCTNLTKAPTLPATTLAYQCYLNMFIDCTSLTTAPVLPATTLADYCYYRMFKGCTNLTKAPTLPATTLADYCYYGMFRDCTNLTTLPTLPATSLADYCYFDMFRGCESIKLSDTNTGEYKTPYRIPTSGTGTAATTSLSNMFFGTGGTFKSVPSINTTYYTSNAVV